MPAPYYWPAAPKECPPPTCSTPAQCGPVRGQVELVGMPKADSFLAQRNTAPQ
nr:hypothetical protein [Tanacetum cinerariifolium]